MADPKWTRAHLEALTKELLGSDDDPKSRRRSRILKAATELFIAQGYRKTSVDEIARRAEVAKGTVYLHFESKAELLLHAIALEKQVLLDRFAAVFDDSAPGEQRLRRYLVNVLTSARDLPLVARLMSGDNELMVALEQWDPAVIERGHAFGEEWLMHLIEDAAPHVHDAAERRRRAAALLTLNWMVVLLLDERVRGGRSLGEIAETLADVLVWGLVHRPPARSDHPADDAEGERR